LNEHFYRDVIVEHTLTKKQSETLQSIEKPPTRDGNSAVQTEEQLDDNSPPDSPKPKKKSRELAGFEISLGYAWKRLAEGSRWNRSVKDTWGDIAQLAREDEVCEGMIRIYTVAAISDNDDHEDAIDPRFYKAATKSPLAKTWDTAMKEELDAIGQRQVFGDFVQLPEGSKALSSHWVYKIKRNGAGNVQRYKARLVC
jgi:hypothetical protein